MSAWREIVDDRTPLYLVKSFLGWISVTSIELANRDQVVERVSRLEPILPRPRRPFRNSLCNTTRTNNNTPESNEQFKKLNYAWEVVQQDIENRKHRPTQTLPDFRQQQERAYQQARQAQQQKQQQKQPQQQQQKPPQQQQQQKPQQPSSQQPPHHQRNNQCPPPQPGPSPSFRNAGYAHTYNKSADPGYMKWKKEEQKARQELRRESGRQEQSRQSLKKESERQEQMRHFLKTESERLESTCKALKRECERQKEVCEDQRRMKSGT
ncbi:hypothetical protein B0H63DRAFT_561740 [Podospora didyma]|uniref:Uncharacterized protein n=1 Tax=Podospora didyma TaxID=330526 RepID=A0AAE0KIX4_9PEZI|nr:hypothetical protein B0H63DRAFT_561740 [Podospora didyma]